MSSCTRRLFFAVTMSFVLGCGEDPPPAPPPPPPAPPPAPIVASRRIAEQAAFALVPAGEGALLLWGAPYAEGGGVRAIRLGPRGEAVAAEARVTSRGAAGGGSAEALRAHPIELAAAAHGRRVGLAWVLDHGEALETQAAYSLDGGLTFSAPIDLGPSVRLERDRGGRLSMATSAELGLMLQHRIPEADCVASSGTCARLARVGLATDAVQERRGDSPLEIQRPCDPLISGSLAHGGTSYYAICHEESGSPRTMTYVIRPEVDYAAAVDSADGCVPEGIAPLDDGVAVVTRCGGAVSALVLDAMGRDRARLAPPERAASCERGRPVLRLGGAHQLHLGQAADHLEALLPESMAPAGARAIWTGEALLVAAPIEHDVSVRRYECRGERLDRTDIR